MTNSSADNANAELLKLQHDYIQRLPERLAQLRDSWQHYLQHGDADSLSDLHRHAHSMAGTAGVLGVCSVSEQARHIEQLLSTRNSAELQPEIFKQLAHALSELEQHIYNDRITASRIQLGRS